MTMTHFSRRAAIRAGSVGLLGLQELACLASSEKSYPHRAVIYIFLSGGLAQHESFDPKPEGPVDVRGEFKSIPTRIPSLHISEHLPLLAQRSHQWSLIQMSIQLDTT